MASRLFIVSCELTSGFSLNLAKKSKGVFGSLKDEDFLSPVSNVLGIWDKIKGVSSSFNFQISSEIIFCAHLLGGKNKKRTSMDFSPTVNIADQFFVKNIVVGSNLSAQNTRLFDLRENIDFGKIQILNTIKSNGNLADGYQVGVVSIFSAEDPSNIIKFQQNVTSFVSGKGNATISFIEIEESRNISFSDISVDSKKITGKLIGDYSDKRPLAEIRSGIVILAEHFSDVCGDASLKKLLDNKNTPQNQKDSTQFNPGFSGISFSEYDLNRLEAAKEDYMNLKNLSKRGSQTGKHHFDKIYHLSLIKVVNSINEYFLEPASSKNLTILHNTETDQCAFIIGEFKNQTWLLSDEGFLGGSEYFILELLEEPNNLRTGNPIYNLDIGANNAFITGIFEKDFSDFEFETQMVANIGGAQNFESPEFLGCYGLRLITAEAEVEINGEKLEIFNETYEDEGDLFEFLETCNVEFAFASHP